jgi:hypothetical protein
MKWTILDSDITESDSTGVDGFIQRMDQELRSGGPPLEGFKCLYSSQEMLQITREIENETIKSPYDASILYVGFQTVSKFNNETERYRKINSLGIPVVGFGKGETSNENVSILDQWVDLPDDTKAFENQWYLICLKPTPVIFIGWETSDTDMFGRGGISTAGKEFKGFVSNDQRIINAAIAYLERVRRQYGPTTSMSLTALSEEIPFPINRMMIITDDNQNNQVGSMRENAADFAVKNNAYLMLYDISAASYLVNPYPSTEAEKEWTKVLYTQDLGIMGRQYLVDQLSYLSKKDLCAGAILATEHGFRPLANWAEKEAADVIMIPQSMVNPGLIDRIKGYTLKKLIESTTIPIIVYEDTNVSWMRTQKSRPARGTNREQMQGSLNTLTETADNLA